MSWANRYRVERAGWKYGVIVGDGIAHIARFWRRRTAERYAAHLLTAFRDGQYVIEKGIKPSGVGGTVNGNPQA